MLLALELVLSDGQFVAALRTEVARARFINSSQATNLDHALEHAGRREYVHPCAALYWGLEGAFWEVGYAKAVVTLQRTDPTKMTRSLGFESMVKRLKLGQELQTFMVRGLYGTTGNPHRTLRHGGSGYGRGCRTRRREWSPPNAPAVSRGNIRRTRSHGVVRGRLWVSPSLWTEDPGSVSHDRWRHLPV